MLKVLIADDHEIVRRGIKQILQEEFSFAQIDEASDTDTLIAKARTNGWDIIISDMAMPGGGGLKALHHIQLEAPQVPVLILSIYPEEQYALRVIKAGAAGYLNKDAAPDELINAVRKILSGKKFITPEVAEQLSSSLHQHSELSAHDLLSKREFNVFILLAGGKSIGEIAGQLSLGATTISTYRSRILTKMNKKNNAELIQYAIAHKLI